MMSNTAIYGEWHEIAADNCPEVTVTRACAGVDGEVDLALACRAYREELAEVLQQAGLELIGVLLFGPAPRPQWWFNPASAEYTKLCADIAAVDVAAIVDRYCLPTKAQSQKAACKTAAGYLDSYTERAFVQSSVVLTIEEEKELGFVLGNKAQSAIGALAGTGLFEILDHRAGGGQVEVVTWDFKEAVDPQEIVDAITAASGGAVHAYKADNGTDDYVLVVSTFPLTGREITAAATEER